MATATPLWNSILFDQTAFGGAALNGLACQSGSGIIYAALRKAGVTLGPQRTPSPAQMQDGLDEMKRLIPSLNCDRLFIYGLDTLTFPLTAGQKSYTIGQDPAGGPVDFATPWPFQIVYANALAGDPSMPLRYRMTVATPQTWASLGIQDLQGGLPAVLYWDRGYPVGTISILPQASPDVSALELYVWHPIGSFQSPSDTVCMPPGYADALTLKLAIRLAPQFQLPVNPDLRLEARESMMRLESLNAPQPILDIPWSCSYGFGDGGGGFFVAGGAGSAGAPGPTGPAGPPGIPGQAATVAVGATATGPPGTPAAVYNAGTPAAAVLDFTIPQGNAGAQGPPGAASTVPGPPGAASTVPGPMGPQGPPGPPGTGTLGLTIDGGGSPVTPGVKGYISAQYAGAITGWDIVADQTGGISIDISRHNASVPNTTSDKISGSSPVTLSTAQLAQSGSVAGWTSTSVSVGDVFGFNVTGASTVTRVTIELKVTKA